MDTKINVNSVAEEDVATMLPTVGLDGEPLEDSSIEHEEDTAEVKKKIFENSEFDDIEFSEAVIEYMNNPEVQYDDVVEEGVGKVVDKLKERVVVSNKTCKLVVDIYILKKRIKHVEKSDKNKNVIDMKRELIQKQKELSEVKRTASPELQKEISKIEENLERRTPKIDIDNIKTESAEDMLLTVKESLEELDSVNKDENFITEKEDEKTLPPELKRLDEIRGQIENLTDDLNRAKEKLSETGEKIYENKIKGLTAKIDKLKKELAQKEKDAEKLQEKNVNESSDLINEAHAVTLDGRINYWKQMIEATEQRIKEKVALLKKTTFAGTIKTLESEVFELRAKLKKYQRTLSDLIEQKKNNGGAKVVYASTDDILYESVVEEAADMEDEIKPIVDKLNSKGYKVKYASPGHAKLRKKEDAQPDGVYYGKLYSDARVMFDDKYSFPNAPKYWHWREVDDCSYLDITPISYNKSDGTPDEAFKKWKDDYMTSLKSFVDELKDNSEKDVTESVDEFVNTFMEEIFEKMGFNDINDTALYVNESMELQKDTKTNLLEELDNLLS